MAKKVLPRDESPAAPDKREAHAKHLKPVLSEEVAKKYRLKTIRAGKYDFFGFGVIDLRTISTARADELVKKGFKYLVPLDPPEKKEDKKEDPKK